MFFRPKPTAHENHYRVLGVDTSSSPDEIKKAFRDLVKFHHPDQFSNGSEKQEAERQLREIITSYKTLSNPQSRLQYDLHDGRNQIDNGSFWNRDSSIRKQLRKLWRQIGAPAILAGAIFTYVVLGAIALVAIFSLFPKKW